MLIAQLELTDIDDLADLTERLDRIVVVLVTRGTATIGEDVHGCDHVIDEVDQYDGVLCCREQSPSAVSILPYAIQVGPPGFGGGGAKPGR